MLIAGRCRREDESLLIKETLEINFKKKIDLDNVYGGGALSTNVLSEKVRCEKCLSLFTLSLTSISNIYIYIYIYIYITL